MTTSNTARLLSFIQALAPGLEDVSREENETDQEGLDPGEPLEEHPDPLNQQARKRVGDAFDRIM